MEYKPVSGRDLPRFAGIKTFFRLPHVPIKADYDIALVGVPFDGSLSYRPGARFAPGKIREMSALGRIYHWERQMTYIEKIKVADVGDVPIVPIDVMKTYEIIEKYFSELLKKDKKFISVGGDHSTTLPILRALNKKYKKPLAVIHFDAHLDTYPAAWGCEYHHGAFMRHAIEEGLVDGKKLCQVGIRGPLAGKDDLDFVKKHGVHVVTVNDIRNAPLENIAKKINKIIGKDPAYITFDIDCLDPAYAPGTGTPVVGGLTTYETQTILRGLRVPNMVGADIVEVSPPYDHSDITSLAAVDTLFELLNIYAADSKK
ncbi:MAG: agmatinase [Bdellovibrionales bacterium]|nr:agmatinase [Bdellovibrionales bacterium]